MLLPLLAVRLKDSVSIERLSLDLLLDNVVVELELLMPVRLLILNVHRPLLQIVLHLFKCVPVFENEAEEVIPSDPPQLSLHRAALDRVLCHRFSLPFIEVYRGPSILQFFVGQGLRRQNSFLHCPLSLSKDFDVTALPKNLALAQPRNDFLLHVDGVLCQGPFVRDSADLLVNDAPHASLG